MILFLGATGAQATSHYQLLIPIQSSADGIAEVYFDTGGGFIKNQRSARRVTRSDSLQILAFDVPAGVSVRALRFDPLNGPGKFKVGPATLATAGGRVIREFSLDAYQIRQQLVVSSKDNQAVSLQTPVGASDPIVLIKLSRNLELPAGTSLVSWKGASYSWPVGLDVGLTCLALILVATTLLPAQMARAERFSDSSLSRLEGLERVAAKWSDPELIVFDRASVGSLLAALLIFVVACAAGLHGSSTAIWDYHIALQKPHNGLLLGQSKAIRSDEITVFTPDIFSQVFSRPAFRDENDAVGGAKSVLFWSFPVNHFIEVPRFFLWGFHFLPISLAFSLYWNFKALVLFLGCYLLLLVLTRSRSWLALGGALWIYFSSFTQWWFSHCLPETIGFAALTLVGALYLLLSHKPHLVFTSAVLFTVSLLNFCLIFYPPFTIPVLWVMLAAGTGILIEKRRLMFAPASVRFRWILLSASLSVCVITLIAYFVDTRTTIHLVLNTVYPGRRINTGGTESLLALFSGFIDPVFTETYFPRFATNVCTGTHFYLVGLLLLPCILLDRPGWRRCSMTEGLIALLAVVMMIFALFGFPQLLAKATLFSMTETKRMRVGLGLSAVLLTMCYLARRPSGRRIDIADWRLTAYLLIVLGVGAAFFAADGHYVLPISAIIMLVAVNGALVLFAVAGRGLPFFCLLLPFLLTHNFLINPVAHGFEAITDKNLYREVRDIDRSDPQGKWAVFGSFQIANFLKFCGVEVINGNKFYPVFDYNNIMDPSHSYISIWNGYAHVQFLDAGLDSRISYERLRGPVYCVHVSARSRALRQIGVRYYVFTYPPPSDYATAVIKKVEDGSKAYWIVRADLLQGRL